jgi:predicted ribosome-associated RNA-binding protein Tma20
VQSGILTMQSGVRDMQSAIGEQRKKYAEGAAEMIQSGTDAMKQGILAMQAGVRDMQSAIGEQRKKYAVGAAAFQSGVNEMVANIAAMRVAIAKHAQDNQAYIKKFIG